VTTASLGVLRRLSRRVRTLIVAAIVFFVLLALTLTLHVPYVLLSPGPTYNTLGTDGAGHKIIAIRGTATKPTTGHLNMTTVDVSTRPISVFAALSGWLMRTEVVVPRSSVYPPGQSQRQVDQENHAEFTASQDSAITAAACELGYPKRLGVTGVRSPGPSANKLDPGDQITALNGTAVTTAAQLTQTLDANPPGSTITVSVLREGAARTVRVKLGPAIEGRSGGSLGIELGRLCQLPFSVDLGLGNQIGGPSAGMMFALGILDKVGKTDLTHGRFIAGTGTIDADGTVGPIGGIQLKMIAARNAGATVFLAPAGNCSDVVGAVPSGLRVVKVSTLHGAVTDLQGINARRAVPSC
jgi:PDZ domain-containing protein